MDDSRATEDHVTLARYLGDTKVQATLKLHKFSEKKYKEKLEKFGSNFVGSSIDFVQRKQTERREALDDVLFVPSFSYFSLEIRNKNFDKLSIVFLGESVDGDFKLNHIL